MSDLVKNTYKIAAAILAGGRSVRMGSPKDAVVIPGDGRTFLGRICDEVDIIFPYVISGRYISLRPDQDIRREGYVYVPDRFEGAGPLGGIASVLLTAADDGFDAVLVLACDMIRYDHEEIGSICGCYRGEDVLFARSGVSLIEPLASIYSVSAADTIVSMIGRKKYRIKDLAEEDCSIAFFDSGRSLCYENRNTPYETENE